MLLEFDSYSYRHPPGLERIIFSTFSKTEIKFTANFRLILFMIISQRKYKYKKELSIDLEAFLKILFKVEFETNYIENKIEFDISQGSIVIKAESYIM
jgi:hypothetical protein